LNIGQATSQLLPKYEIPTNGATSYGHSLLQWNNGILNWNISFTVTNVTQAVIQGPDNLNVLLFNSSQFDTVTGSDVIDANSYLSGNSYINIASTAFPLGEIRGNIKWANVIASVVLYPDTSGTTDNIGIAMVAVSADNSTLQIELMCTIETASIVSITLCGPAYEYETAGILLELEAQQRSFNLFTINTSLAADILDGATYISIQTTTYPNGELRGQITLFGQNPLIPIVCATPLGSGGEGDCNTSGPPENNMLIEIAIAVPICFIFILILAIIIIVAAVRADKKRKQEKDNSNNTYPTTELVGVNEMPANNLNSTVVQVNEAIPVTLDN